VPVERFRSIVEMNTAPVALRSSTDAAGFEQFVRHCARYRRISRRAYPRGVFRFRGVDDPRRNKRSLG